VLLAVLKEHREEILALLPLPPLRPSLAIGPAKATGARLRLLGFRPYLNDRGSLLIADVITTRKRKRDVSERLPIGEVFNTLVAGLADDPGLLDS
jgi:hypothetical protein